MALHAEACMRPHSQATQTVRATAQTMGEEVRVMREDAAKEREAAARFREMVTQALSNPSRPSSSSSRGGERNSDRSGDRSGRPRSPNRTLMHETRCYHCAALGHQRASCPVWRDQMAAADARSASHGAIVPLATTAAAAAQALPPPPGSFAAFTAAPALEN